MSTYLVLNDKQQTFENLDEALLAAALDASHPKVYQELEGTLELKAFLKPSEEEEAPKANGHRRKRAVRRSLTPVPEEAKSESANGHGRGKRSADDLAKLRTKILSWVVTNPGQGAESMSKNLGVPTKEMVLPIRQLLAEGKMMKEGQARAVKYFPPGAKKAKAQKAA